MTQRERILAIVVGALLAVAALHWVVKYKVLAPIEARKSEFIAVENEVARLQEQERNARFAEFDLNEWKTLALPADISRAATLYHDYLRGLLDKSGIRLPTITPESPSNRGDQFRLLTFQVKAKSGIDELVRFLHTFHQDPLLHQIQHLSITPVVADGRTNTVEVSFAVEALSLRDAISKDALPANRESGAARRRFVSPPLDALALVSEKNLFQPTKWTNSDVKRGAERQDFIVRGTMVADTRGTLLVVNQKSNERILVPEGDYLRVAGIAAKVLTVAMGEAILEIDGERGRLRLGENLSNWKKLEIESQAE